MAATDPVLAVTGLLAEARIAAGPGVATLAGGGDSARLALLLQAAFTKGIRAVISFGIAGGLHPDLEAGTAIVGCSISHGGERFGCDPDWVARLHAALPGAVLSDLVGADRAVCTVEEKRALRTATGAAAVDMESHLVARLAALHGVPFAAVRIVADPSHRALPRAAAVGMRPDGSTDIAAVLRALRLQPSALPGLVRAALDARTAMAALRGCRRRLTPMLSFEGGPPVRRDGAPPSIERLSVSAAGVPMPEIPAESA